MGVNHHGAHTYGIHDGPYPRRPVNIAEAHGNDVQRVEPVNETRRPVNLHDVRRQSKITLQHQVIWQGSAGADAKRNSPDAPAIEANVDLAGDDVIHFHTPVSVHRHPPRLQLDHHLLIRHLGDGHGHRHEVKVGNSENLALGASEEYAHGVGNRIRKHDPARVDRTDLDRNQQITLAKISDAAQDPKEHGQSERSQLEFAVAGQAGEEAPGAHCGAASKRWISSLCWDASHSVPPATFL